jgi:hypothetical protein
MEWNVHKDWMERSEQSPDELVSLYLQVDKRLSKHGFNCVKRVRAESVVSVHTYREWTELTEHVNRWVELISESDPPDFTRDLERVQDRIVFRLHPSYIFSHEHIRDEALVFVRRVEPLLIKLRDQLQHTRNVVEDCLTLVQALMLYLERKLVDKETMEEEEDDDTNDAEQDVQDMYETCLASVPDGSLEIHANFKRACQLVWESWKDATARRLESIWEEPKHMFGRSDVWLSVEQLVLYLVRAMDELVRKVTREDVKESIDHIMTECYVMVLYINEVETDHRWPDPDLQEEMADYYELGSVDA